MKFEVTKVGEFCHFVLFPIREQNSPPLSATPIICNPDTTVVPIEEIFLTLCGLNIFFHMEKQSLERAKRPKRHGVYKYTKLLRRFHT